MARLNVIADKRDKNGRAEAVARARDAPAAREQLARVGASLDQALALAQAQPGNPGAEFWEVLDRAFEDLDTYLAGLATVAELRVECRARCSACCTDIPPTFAIEGLRLTRVLKLMSDGAQRIQRSVENARRFQKMLLKNGPPETASNISSQHYRGTQLEFRAAGYPCPILDDNGNCSAYAERPLACRAHIHVLDPALCSPSHSDFLNAERPPLWGDLREAEIEHRLVSISEALGLPGTPNLPWAVATLHQHPLAQP